MAFSTIYRNILRVARKGAGTDTGVHKLSARSDAIRADLAVRLADSQLMFVTGK